MCSWPQVVFWAAIFRINSRRFFGNAGLPTGVDFQRQNVRNPLRCHRIRVSRLRHPNSTLKWAISHLTESSARG